MAWIKPDEKYWENKIVAYFHDPIDKIFDIKGHENRANEIIKILTGYDKPSDEFWKTADAIAASFERGIVPSYNKDVEKSGAIDFSEKPIITHPTSSKDSLLNITLKEDLIKDKDSFHKKVIKFFERESEIYEGINIKYEKNSDKRSINLFNKFTGLHLLSRFKLSYENIGELGGFWHRIPADTRFPDHTIWQHNAITSAIASCMGFENQNFENIGLMVFSINPVQSFISKARKLRDFWIGSIVLSWLAFEGIVWIIENLGCDNVIYPSLIDQNLVYQYLKMKGIINGNEEYILNKSSTIASFPNKFLFFIPFDNADDISVEIKNTILAKWQNIKHGIMELLINDLSIGEDNVKDILDRQFDSYWDFNWSAVKIINNNFIDTVKPLIDEQNFREKKEIFEIFCKIDESLNTKREKNVFNSEISLMSIGQYYSISHTLLQGLLASTKQIKKVNRKPENGEKCVMCGEYEVFNTFNAHQRVEFGSKDYKDNIRGIWKKIVDKYSDIEVKENEKLCSICLAKRLFKRIMEKQKNHILYDLIKDSDNFPQTSEIALYSYFLRNNITDKAKRREIAQKKFENKKEKIDDTDNADNYYAILKMDGDKMGDLINGKTIGSTWETIIHPTIVEKIKDENFFKDISKEWQKILKIKRNVTPSIHMAISESLSDFSNYTVRSIVEKYDGRLIYAGGDDVCAILPTCNAIKAANEIRNYYISNFNKINLKNGSILLENINGNYNPSEGKLSVNLGVAENISISAGILICHYKAKLSHMIEESDNILEKAKKEGGRNSVAICLKKRSGQERYFVSKWNDDKLNDFIEVSKNITKSISKSLIYRLDYFIDGLVALKNSKEDFKDNIIKFVESLLIKSDTTKVLFNDLSKEERNKKLEELTNKIVSVILNYSYANDSYSFNFEPLIIASFLTEYNEKPKKKNKIEE